MSKNGEMSGRAPQEVAHATLKGGTFANVANGDATCWPAVANAPCCVGEYPRNEISHVPLSS